MHSSFHQGIISTVSRIEHGTCPIRREEAQQKALKVEIHQPRPEMTALNGTLESSKHSDKDYVQFVHASLGFPAPTTFMDAARKGFINGTNQCTRLT
jgi:hypothetical protein